MDRGCVEAFHYLRVNTYLIVDHRIVVLVELVRHRLPKSIARSRSESPGRLRWMNQGKLILH